MRKSIISAALVAAFVMNGAGAAPSPIVKNHQLSRVTFNLKGKPRHDKIGEQDYLVIPMVMITEGVHNGSQGALYYPEEELAADVNAWNHKPITVYHPVINGEGCSACDPAVLTAQGIGIILNTHWKKPKLLAEAWLIEDRVKKVDNRILEKLKKGEAVEVSTGLFTDNEQVSGTWGPAKEKYEAIARNYSPDHLAVLPDVKGACSIEDGAGLLQNAEKTPALNEVSFFAIHGLLSKALRSYMGQEAYAYVEDVFSKFFVFSYKQTYWKMDYTATDTEATLTGTPMEVVRVVQYRSPDGTVIANSERKSPMQKKQLVDRIIANGAGVWTEKDRDYLMNKEESALSKLAPSETREEASAEKPTPALVSNSTPPMVQPSPAPAVPPVPKAPPTLNEYIAAAPPEIAALLSSSLRTAQATKDSLIAGIVANKSCPFTKEELAAKSVDELQKIAKLSGVTQNQIVPTFGGLADAYAGVAGVPQNSGVAVFNTEPLEPTPWGEVVKAK